MCLLLHLVVRLALLVLVCCPRLQLPNPHSNAAAVPLQQNPSPPSTSARFPAVVCAQPACVLLAAVALVVPRLLMIGSALCRASAPAGKPQPLHRRLLHSQLHLACWQQ